MAVYTVRLALYGGVKVSRFVAWRGQDRAFQAGRAWDDYRL